MKIYGCTYCVLREASVCEDFENWGLRESSFCTSNDRGIFLGGEMLALMLIPITIDLIRTDIYSLVA